MPLAEYSYDAWGNLLGIEDKTTDGSGQVIAEANPLRYRGYYYDTETKFYYLNSRYYDPETGRFINGDEFAQTGQGLLDKNIFAYCLNNPVDSFLRGRMANSTNQSCNK